MKNVYCSTLAFVLLTANYLHAQTFQTESVVFHANDIRTIFAAGGSMFWDGQDDIQYVVPYQNESSPGTFYTGSLWLGAIDDDGQLRVAGQTFGLNGDVFDYYPGPLDPATGLPFSTEDLLHFNKVWSVERFDVEQHIADYEDNGTIDQPVLSVIGWPGQRNPYFSTVNGYKLPEMPNSAAPFFDRNGDGRYNAFQGDYPLPEGVASGVIPEQMVWQVYNDAAGQHLETGGAALGVEIQLTAWAFRCFDNPLLNSTLFVSQKIINRSGRDYSDVYAGIWSDIEIGCHKDDYAGCAPDLNSYFAYNAQPEDQQSCDGIHSYGEFPPTQAVTFLNHQMSGFQVHYNGINAPPSGTTDPNTAIEFYRSLTGSWKDGTPLTIGGAGYAPGAPNLQTTHFAFPDNPNDPDGWSQYAENLPPYDVRGVGTVLFETFKNGEVKKIDVAFSTHFDPKLNHVEQVSLIYDEVPKIKAMYEAGFPENTCIQPSCEADCIWPGDANNDGIANHYDLLAMGQGFGETGPSRYASNVWTPQPGGDWLQSLPAGLNFKYLDADGNGKVEFADFNLTKLHYGKYRQDYLENEQYIEGDDFYLSASVDLNDGVLDRSEGFFNLFVNSQPLDSLVGLALTLEFDTNYFEQINAAKTSLSGFPSHSFVTRNDHNRLTGELHFAVFKDDGSSILEHEKLFSALIIHPKAVLPSTNTTIRFKNIRGVLQNGKEVTFGGQDMDLVFSDFEVKKIKPQQPELHIYPNPSDGVFYLQLDQEEVGDLRIVDAMGRLVDVKPTAHQRDFLLDLSDYASGVYFMQLTRQSTVETWILVVSK